MTTMQAVSLTATTDIADISTRSIERARPLAHQVEIQMLAAGINPMDWDSASGPHAWISSFPHTLGNEGAGTVVAVGSEVEGLKIGDKVLAYRFGDSPGMFAEYNTVDATHVAVLPDRLDAQDWAASAIGILSVYHAFYKRGLPATGTSILIEGTGGVGMFAIQWAKKLGFRVTALSTARSRQWAQDLGADQAVTSDVEIVAPEGFDIIFSTLGGLAIPRLAGFLARNGRFVSTMPLQVPEGQEATVASQLGSVGMSAVFKQNSWEWFLAEPNGRDLAFMLSEAVRLNIRCPIAHRFPLAQTSEALTQAARGGNRGKVLLTMGSSSHS